MPKYWKTHNIATYTDDDDDYPFEIHIDENWPVYWFFHRYVDSCRGMPYDLGIPKPASVGKKKYCGVPIPVSKGQLSNLIAQLEGIAYRLECDIRECLGEMEEDIGFDAEEEVCILYPLYGMRQLLKQFDWANYDLYYEMEPT